MIPMTHTLVSFLLVGLVVGVGNGMGSGINMTLGADFAADSEPGVFLGLWRLITDVGGAAAPFLVGVVTSALALGPASVVIAAAGLAGRRILRGGSAGDQPKDPGSAGPLKAIGPPVPGA